MSYGSKSYWPIRLHDISQCSFSLITWLLGMIIIDIISVLEVLTVVLEIKEKTLLLVIVNCIPCPLGIFIDYFVLLIKKLPTIKTENWLLVILILMLFENAGKVDLLIQNFNLSQRSQCSTHVHEGLVYRSCFWYFRLHYCFFSTVNL